MAKFDLSQTQVLMELFDVEREKRDDGWRRQFYEAVPDASLIGFDPQISQGPDLLPYFELAIPDPGPLTPFCITHILDSCLDNGFGVTIWRDSQRSGGPEWVFSYGGLLSYSLWGRFDGEDSEGRASESEVAGKAHEMLVASPSEEYLPTRARKAIGRFVRHYYHHPDPKIALVVNPQMNPAQNLMINLTLDQYDGDEQKLHSAVGYLQWFLPTTYRVMAMPDGWSDAQFAPLG